MVVVVNRVLPVALVIRVFFYSLVAKNSLVFYSFLALWFNIPAFCFKFLVRVNTEFKGGGIKTPSFFILVTLSKHCIISFILSLPDYTKKGFLFGFHSLDLSGFDLFKLSFWLSIGSFWWVGFRSYFTGFSLVLSLKR
jgi:hypothetical protein